MDSSQDSFFRPLCSGDTHDSSAPTDALSLALDTPTSTTTAASSQALAPQTHNSFQTQRQSDSSNLAAQMALLLPPAPSFAATPLPFTMATPVEPLHLAGMAAQTSGLPGHEHLDLSLTLSSLTTSADNPFLSQTSEFPLASAHSTASTINQSWNAPSSSTARDAASSLGLFIPTHDQNPPATLTSSFVSPEMQSQPSKNTMTVPRSLSTSFMSLNRQLPHLQSQTISSNSDWQAPFTVTSSDSGPSAAGNLTQQQMLAYKQSLTKAHTDRLGGLLGLQHPLTLAAGQRRPHSLQSSHFERAFDAKQPPMLPQGCDDLIMVVDQEDTIVWTSDSMRACADMLSNSTGNAEMDDVYAGWRSETSAGRRIKVSDLLADDQAVSWWQQACREIRLSQQQISADTERTSRRRKEIILARRNAQNEEMLIELTIVATRNHQVARDGCLMVQLRNVAIPAIAAVSSQPTMGSSLFHPSRTLLGGGNSSGALGNAELRLLVSRNGLILRTTSPSALSSSLLQGDSPRRCGEARAIFALFGEGASVPAFGQSLVEVPKLAPLLHVVTQAAVVGLAQTVQLTSGGRQITATVQPVLRTRSIDAEGSRRVHAAAAKVWITLSAPSTVMRRSSAIMTPTRTGLGGNTSGGMGTTQLFTPQSRAAALDRRHSYQVFKPESSFQAPRWPLSFHEQAEGGASAASLYAHAVSARTASTSRSHSSAMGKGRESSTQHMPAPLSQESQKTRSEEIFPVNDSLSMLMAQLEEDNRNLRRQIDARRSRRQIQAPVFAQPFAQPFTQPQWSPAPTQSLQGAQMSYPPSYSPLSEEAMPGSCPTRLMYLP